MFYVMTLQHTIIYSELQENRLYKEMFNAIQDSVVLIQNDDVKYINRLALGLLGMSKTRDGILTSPMLFKF